MGAERNAKAEEEREYDEEDADSQMSDDEDDSKQQSQSDNEEYDDEELDAKPKRTAGNTLATPDTNSKYDRVVSYSKNEMPDSEAMSKNGYQDPDAQTKRKKKKKRKKNKVVDDDEDYTEY